MLLPLLAAINFLLKNRTRPHPALCPRQKSNSKAAFPCPPSTTTKTQHPLFHTVFLLFPFNCREEIQDRTRNLQLSRPFMCSQIYRKRKCHVLKCPYAWTMTISIQMISTRGQIQAQGLLNHANLSKAGGLPSFLMLLGHIQTTVAYPYLWIK